MVQYPYKCDVRFGNLSDLSREHERIQARIKYWNSTHVNMHTFFSSCLFSVRQKALCIPYIPDDYKESYLSYQCDLTRKWLSEASTLSRIDSRNFDVNCGSPTLIIADQAHLFDPFIHGLDIYRCTVNRLPHNMEILVCTPETTSSLIFSFISRIFASEDVPPGLLFTIFNPTCLSSRLQEEFIQILNSAIRACYIPYRLLIIINTRKGLINDHFQACFRSGFANSNPKQLSHWIQSHIEPPNNSNRSIFVFTSKTPGVGCSRKIMKNVSSIHGVPRIRITLHDVVTSKSFVNASMLENAISSGKIRPNQRLNFLINVSSSATGFVNAFLFKLLIMKYLDISDGTFILLDPLYHTVYLEVDGERCFKLNSPPTVSQFPLAHFLPTFVLMMPGETLPDSFTDTITRIPTSFDSFITSLKVTRRVVVTLRYLNNYALDMKNISTAVSSADLSVEETLILLKQAGEVVGENFSWSGIRALQDLLGYYFSLVRANDRVLSDNRQRFLYSLAIKSATRLFSSAEILDGDDRSIHLTELKFFQQICHASSCIFFDSGIAEALDMSSRALHNVISSVANLRKRRSGDSILHLYDKKVVSDTSFILHPSLANKVLLIFSRIEARVPIILNGETGCGKTRTLLFLASLKHSKLIHIRVHGGFDSNHLILECKKAISIAKRHWEGCHQTSIFFFDEINTANCLGLFKEIVCDHSLNGVHFNDIVGKDWIKKVLKNSNSGRLFTVVGAINPYIRRSKKESKRYQHSGLALEDSGPVLASTGNDLTDLVYRVHPLPRSLLKYVWNFGLMNHEVEALSTRNIIAASCDLEDIEVEFFSNIVSACHQFLRSQDSDCRFVSFRDIEHVVKVFKLFISLIVEFPEKYQYFHKLILISICTCYITKLEDKNAIYNAIPVFLDVKDDFQEFKLFFASNAEIPHGIALNEALTENIFLMIICIELRIPLFLIGAPGTSKSLAKHIVASSMIGERSASHLFRKMRAAQFFSFQCSPQTRSCDLENHFEMAQAFKSDAVILLEEIGLAEMSPSLPLKILHQYLDNPDSTAFVAMSNWALDPAKMNRGIWLNRSMPDANELISTALDICAVENYSFKSEEIEEEFLDLSNRKNILRSMIKAFAESFAEVTSTMLASSSEFSRPVFFALRDFYSACKFLNRDLIDGVSPFDAVNRSILRNFDGLLPDQQKRIFAIFEKHLTLATGEEYKINASSCVLLDRIKDSLFDSNSRFPLVITSNPSNAISILQTCGALSNSPTVFFGSAFETDKSFTHICTVLSQLKFAMEVGNTVVLVCLNLLYESLYELLNQYWTSYGQLKFVDIGLGAHLVKSTVHPDFKLMVMAPHDDAYSRFPTPLLNRFEKHLFSFDELLPPSIQVLIKKVSDWVVSLENSLNGRFNDNVQNFRPRVFVSNLDDLSEAVASLMFHLDITSDFSLESLSSDNANELIMMAQDVLLLTTSPEGVLALPSDLSDEILVRCTPPHSRYDRSSLINALWHEMNSQSPQNFFITSFSPPRLSEEILMECGSCFPSRVFVLLNVRDFDSSADFIRRIDQYRAMYANIHFILIIQIEVDGSNNSYDFLRNIEYDVRNAVSKSNCSFSTIMLVYLRNRSRRCYSISKSRDGFWVHLHIDELAQNNFFRIFDLFKLGTNPNPLAALLSYISDDIVQKMLPIVRYVATDALAHINFNESYKFNRDLIFTDNYYDILRPICKRLSEKLFGTENSSHSNVTWLKVLALFPMRYLEGSFSSCVISEILRKISAALSIVISALCHNNACLSPCSLSSQPIVRKLWCECAYVARLEYSSKTSTMPYSNIFQSEQHTLFEPNSVTKDLLLFPFSWLLFEKINFVLNISSLLHDDDEYDITTTCVQNAVGTLRPDILMQCLFDLENDKITQSKLFNLYLCDFVSLAYIKRNRFKSLYYLLLSKWTNLFASNLSDSTSLVEMMVILHLVFYSSAARFFAFSSALESLGSYNKINTELDVIFSSKSIIWNAQELWQDAAGILLGFLLHRNASSSGNLDGFDELTAAAGAIEKIFDSTSESSEWNWNDSLLMRLQHLIIFFRCSSSIPKKYMNFLVKPLYHILWSESIDSLWSSKCLAAFNQSNLVDIGVMLDELLILYNSFTKSDIPHIVDCAKEAASKVLNQLVGFAVYHPHLSKIAVKHVLISPGSRFRMLFHLLSAIPSVFNEFLPSECQQEPTESSMCIVNQLKNSITTLSQSEENKPRLIEISSSLVLIFEHILQDFVDNCIISIIDLLDPSFFRYVCNECSKSFDSFTQSGFVALFKFLLRAAALALADESDVICQFQCVFDFISNLPKNEKNCPAPVSIFVNILLKATANECISNHFILGVLPWLPSVVTISKKPVDLFFVHGFPLKKALIENVGPDHFQILSEAIRGIDKNSDKNPIVKFCIEKFELFFQRPFNIVQSIAFHFAIALHSNSSSPLLAPFIRLLYAKDFSKFHFPAMRVSESTILRSVLPEINCSAPNLYKCPNGHPYFIVDCGMPNSVSKCLDCGKSIGGLNHKSEPDNTRASIKITKDTGYTLEKDQLSEPAPSSFGGIPMTIIQRVILHSFGYILALLDHRGLPTMFDPLLPDDDIKAKNFKHFFEIRLASDIVEMGKFFESNRQMGLTVIHGVIKALFDSNITSKTITGFDNLEGLETWNRLLFSNCLFPLISPCSETLRMIEKNIEEYAFNPQIALSSSFGEAPIELWYPCSRLLSVNSIAKMLPNSYDYNLKTIEQDTKSIMMLLQRNQNLELLTHISEVSQLISFLKEELSYKSYHCDRGSIEDFIMEQKLPEDQFECLFSGANTLLTIINQITFSKLTTLSCVIPTMLSQEGQIALKALDNLVSSHNDIVRTARRILKSGESFEVGFTKILPSHSIKLVDSLSIAIECSKIDIALSEVSIETDFQGMVKSLVSEGVFMVPLIVAIPKVTFAENTVALFDRIREVINNPTPISRVQKSQIEAEIRSKHDLLESAYRIIQILLQSISSLQIGESFFNMTIEEYLKLNFSEDFHDGLLFSVLPDMPSLAKLSITSLIAVFFLIDGLSLLIQINAIAPAILESSVVSFVSFDVPARRIAESCCPGVRSEFYAPITSEIESFFRNKIGDKNIITLINTLREIIVCSLQIKSNQDITSTQPLAGYVGAVLEDQLNSSDEESVDAFVFEFCKLIPDDASLSQIVYIYLFLLIESKNQSF